MEEQLLSPIQVATILNVSPWAVRRWFTNYPGVIDLSSHGRFHRMIRIPRAVLDRFMAEHESANRKDHDKVMRVRKHAKSASVRRS